MRILLIFVEGRDIVFAHKTFDAGKLSTSKQFFFSTSTVKKHQKNLIFFRKPFEIFFNMWYNK